MPLCHARQPADNHGNNAARCFDSHQVYSKAVDARLFAVQSTCPVAANEREEAKSVPTTYS